MSSAVLQALKTVNERISENYTSGQLFEVLDTMLYRSVAPLIENTRYVDRVLSIVLAWYAQNHRRRISSLSKKRLTSYIIAFLAEADPKKRVMLYRRMRLERNITFFVIRHWLTIIGPWRMMHVRSCRGEIEKQQESDLQTLCCVRNPDALWHTISVSTYWIDQAANFKDQIVEKYMRKVMVDAVVHCRMQQQNNPHLKIDTEEMAQNFLLAVIKAVDKFDARQGTLTSYVDNWLMNAKITQQFRGEYGTAFSIPHSKKTSIARSKDTTTRNISVALDSPEALAVADERDVEHAISHNQEMTLMRQVAKTSDVSGIGRLLLGIAEVLSPAELQLLKAAS